MVIENKMTYQTKTLEGKQYLVIDCEERGDAICVRIGNTVIDIMHGYNSPVDEPCAITQIYPYDNKKFLRYSIEGVNHINGVKRIDFAGKNKT